jgi:PAS domain S-box-containing protein
MPTRFDTPRRRSALGAALGLSAVGVLLLIDGVAHPDHVPVGLFVVAPLLTAMLATTVPTAAVAGVASVVALAVGIADDLGADELRWRMATVVIGGLLCVLLADQRRRRDEANRRAQAALVEGLEARRNQDVLAATERLVARLEDAQRVGRMGSWEHELASGRVVWSDGMAHLVGAEPGSVTDIAHVRRYIAAEEADRLTGLYRTAMKEGGSFEYSQRMVHRDGNELLTMVVGESLHDGDGRVVGLRGITRDVTEERRTAQRLDQMRTQLLASDRVVDVLQRSMLPQTLPADPRFELAAVYRPVDRAAQIGGDWYDAFRMSDDELGISIGDVAGHGLEATALMAHARLGLRSAGFAGARPGAALGRVDRMLEAETEGRTFATAIFGRYRVVDGQLCWSRAGHCPPVLLTSAGAQSVESSCGGPPLAARLAPEVYVEGLVTLEPGDAVFLYTDGLVERRRRPFDVGVARLKMVLEHHVDEDLATFLPSLPDRLADIGPLEDDCCILALRRLE